MGRLERCLFLVNFDLQVLQAGLRVLEVGLGAGEAGLCGRKQRGAFGNLFLPFADQVAQAVQFAEGLDDVGHGVLVLLPPRKPPASWPAVVESQRRRTSSMKPSSWRLLTGCCSL